MKQNNIYKQISYVRLFSKISFFSLILVSIFSVSVLLSGCGGGGSSADLASVDISQASPDDFAFKPEVLNPTAPGTEVLGNDIFTLDYSNSSEGYIVVNYSGDSERAKFQITGNEEITYTYNLENSLDTVIPLCADSGDYLVVLYENIGGDQYASAFSDTLNVDITNTFGPFLYPNQYVNFNEDTVAVEKAKTVIEGSTSELEAVAKVYDFVINNVTYDHDEAENVEPSYLPDVDEVLSTGKGICFDYASLMTAMLRSQGIPTRLEIGYAKDAYHAWISVYSRDQGWIGGLIQFDGVDWTLMDPTLASNSKDASKIKNFIGDGSSYTTKYIY